MTSVLDRIIADDHAAWGELFLLFDEVAAKPVRRLLRQHGFDVADAEEVVSDMVLSLYADDMRKLRSFKANDDNHLGCWLVKVAINFTLNWIDTRQRARRRERQALQFVEPSDRSGPTAEQMAAALHDLERVSSADVQKLRILAGLIQPAKPIPERTLRRWRSELPQSYRELL